MLPRCAVKAQSVASEVRAEIMRSVSSTVQATVLNDAGGSIGRNERIPSSANEMAAKPSTTKSPSTTRSLGLAACIAVVVGNMVGSGF